MRKHLSSLKSVGLVISTTVGAGIFALPYIFKEAGWVTGFFYLLIFSLVVAAAHFIYFKVLAKLETQDRLLGLVKKYFGAGVFEAAFFSIIGGLVLSLVVYLILGSHFFRLIFPSLGTWTGAIIFWVLSSIPLFFKPKRFLLTELLGGVALVGLIVFLFLSAWPGEGNLSPKVFDFQNIFWPFGAILFSLAGWTAVEPIFERAKKLREGVQGKFRDFAIGAFGSALIYLLFVLLIFVSASEITPDAISGLGNWERTKIAILGIFGLFAIWTSYLPIATEVKNLIEKDLKWKKSWGEGAVIAAPILLLAAGLNDFLEVVGLVGGVFLALQYLFIVLIGQRVLRFKFWGGLLTIVLIVIFGVAAVYEVYYFVIR